MQGVKGIKWGTDENTAVKITCVCAFYAFIFLIASDFPDTKFKAV